MAVFQFLPIRSLHDVPVVETIVLYGLPATPEITSKAREGVWTLNESYGISRCVKAVNGQQVVILVPSGFDPVRLSEELLQVSDERVFAVGFLPPEALS